MGTQTDLDDQIIFTNPPLGNQSKKLSDPDEIVQAILSSLHDDYSSSLEKAASVAQSNDLDDISSLRAVINHRLGEEWSLVVLENARMKSELDNILGRINEEKRNFVSELTNLKFQEANDTEAQIDGKVVEDFTDGTIVLEDEKANFSSEKHILEINIYEQNKVIAKLEMDKLELVKEFQRRKVDSNQNSDEGDNNENAREFKPEGSITDDYLENIVKEKLHKLSTVQQENESLKNELDSLRSKYNALEKDKDDSNKSRESLEKELETLLVREKNLTTNISQINEKCSTLEEQLARSTMENNELKKQLGELEKEVCKVQQEKAQITEQKIALEERMREQQEKTKREMATEREQKTTYEKQLQAKAQEFEEGKTLLKLKETRLSKVEAELVETKAHYEELMQERFNEYELDKENMMKEINSLRCLQGLPNLNKERVKPRQEVKGGSKSGENRAQNKKNNKLNSELTRAKEQLVRLKAELTLSNMQTRNLGLQLSSLREDSTKLEAELSTVRVSPRNLRQRRNSFSYYDETVRLEIELAEAKEKIIDLQEKMLNIYKEKFALEEKIINLEGQRNTSMEDGEKPRSTEHDQEQGFDSEQTKVLENKIGLLEAEKEQLKRELENTNADKSRLEGIEYCVQQLVNLEDEQLRLKSRLKKWTQNDNETTTTANKITENSYFNELRVLSAENWALQEEVNNFKETIGQLESDLAALKLKVSFKDITQESSLDKKAIATLLVSAKQERAELQKALDEVLIEKDDLGEELSEIKVKHARLQREFAMTSMVKDDLELEVLSLKKANLTRGLSSLTQSSEECRSEMSDSSLDDPLMAPSDGNGVENSVEKKLPSPGGGKKRVTPVNNRKTVVTRNHKSGSDSSSSGRSTSSSSKVNVKIIHIIHS